MTVDDLGVRTHRFGLVSKRRYDFSLLEPNSSAKICEVDRFESDYFSAATLLVYVHEGTRISGSSSICVAAKGGGMTGTIVIDSSVTIPMVLKVTLAEIGDFLSLTVTGVRQNDEAAFGLLSIELLVSLAPQSTRALGAHLMRLAESVSLGNVLERYAAKKDYSPEALREHEFELRRFLVVCAACPESIPMGGPIDELWHEFIIHTWLYTGFCLKLSGRYIHHAPASGTEAPRSSWFTFCDWYLKLFGEAPPSHIWPIGETWINSSQWWFDQIPRLADCDASEKGPVERLRSDLVRWMCSWTID